MRLGIPFEVEYLGGGVWRVAFDEQYPEWAVWLSVGDPDTHGWCNVFAGVARTDPDEDGLEIILPYDDQGVVGAMYGKNRELVYNTVDYNEKIDPDGFTYADALAFYLGQAILNFLQSKEVN